MSEEIDPPFDSEDPFEILGVPHDADEGDLKRAYVRLVRRYRPERNPDEFRLVRQAYENALQTRSWLLEGIEGAAEVQDERAAPPDFEPTEKVDFAALLDGGRLGEAREALETAIEHQPQAGEFYVQLFLLDRRSKSFEECFSQIVRGLRNGAEVLVGIMRCASEIDSADLNNLACSDELGWPAIQHQVGVADWLGHRVDCMVLEDRGEELFDEISQPSFARAVGEIPGLNEIGFRVATCEVWRDSDRAMGLVDWLDRDAATSQPWLEDRVLDRLALSKQWRQWSRRFKNQGPLKRFMTNADALSYPARQRLVNDLVERSLEKPVQTYRALKGMEPGAPSLLNFYLESIELPESNDIVERFDKQQFRMLKKAISQADRSLDQDNSNNAANTATGFLILGGIAFFWISIWFGIAAIVCSIAFVVFVLGSADKKLYKAIVAPRVVQLIAASGLTTGHVLGFLQKNTKLTDDIDRFQGDIAEDLGLFAFDATIRRGFLSEEYED